MANKNMDSPYHNDSRRRGYGKTDPPEPVEDYNILQLSGDIVGLIDAVGATFGWIGLPGR
jgi:hypothetical protein